MLSIEQSQLSMKPSRLESLLLLYGRHFPIQRGKLRLINALWRTTVAKRGTQRLATLKHGGLKMLCDLSELLQRQFYFFGTYLVEEQILKCWEKEAKRAKVFFDVGANVGIYSLVALSVQRDATVHAFEPTAQIASRLRQNAALNELHQLHVHQVAVSSSNGHAVLRRLRGSSRDNGGMNFISHDDSHPAAERVVTVSLDSFCEDNRIDHIDLLKIDIQGHEHKALTGAARLLRTARIGMVFFELNWGPDDEGWCPATESIRILETAGYHFAKPSKRLHWQKSGEWMHSLSDVVARRVDTQ